MKPFYKRGSVALYQANVLDLLASLGAKSVNLAFLDPPYHRVKSDLWWDNQWKTDADFLTWMRRVLDKAKDSQTAWWSKWAKLTGKADPGAIRNPGEAADERESWQDGERQRSMFEMLRRTR